MNSDLLFSVSLLVLFTIISCSEEDFDYSESNGGASGRNSAAIKLPSYKLFVDFRELRQQLTQVSKKAGNECNATVDQTFAYFLLGDLFTYHEVDGIVSYMWYRKRYYKEQFKLLESRPTLCSYEDRLICLENKCISCESIKADTSTDQTLTKACNLRGNGGEEIPIDSELPSTEFPLDADIKGITKPLVVDCNDRWLTADDAMKWYLEVKAVEKDGRQSLDYCSGYKGLQQAYGLLNKLGNDGTLEEEISSHRDFYEDQFWLFRGNNWKTNGPGNRKLCSFKKIENEGPWVCGSNSYCVDCQKLSPQGKKHPACVPEERPTDHKNKCVTTTTLRSEKDSGAGGRPKWNGPVLVAAALTLCFV